MNNDGPVGMIAKNSLCVGKSQTRSFADDRQLRASSAAGCARQRSDVRHAPAQELPALHRG